MAIDYFYPPDYQKAPDGSNDSLGPGPGPSDGQPGKDGTSTLTGQTPPSDGLGKDGDTYIQLDPDGQALLYYGQKQDGRWPTTATNLVGAAGKNAPIPYAGEGPPDPNNVGPAGQIYIDRINSDLYCATA